ncbi:hypothetical protein COMA1_11514 [Candidatus Nitrospira nitrosa]|uniref:Uncharacterized protein n=1 Tax=Candidatus Nitrospira nitrosa TaxID=1742972 RepID=A0A0S4L8R4_9BACT|nr:hypothetical protein COMA1_11514 [Candidatus Nitrospira nitrosa]
MLVPVDFFPNEIFKDRDGIHAIPLDVLTTTSSNARMKRKCSVFFLDLVLGVPDSS